MYVLPCKIFVDQGICAGHSGLCRYPRTVGRGVPRADVVVPVLVEIPGGQAVCVTGDAVASADFQIVQPVLRLLHERLFGEPPACAHRPEITPAILRCEFG